MDLELQRLLRAFIRRWYLILIPVVIVGAYVGYQVATTPPTVGAGYTTVVRFSAAQNFDAIPNRDGDFQDIWLSSELTVNTLTEWILTSSFKREVAARSAGYGITIDAAALQTASDQERSVGQMFLSWPDAAELEIIAQAALDVLREDSQRYFSQLGDEPAQVTVLDDIVVVPAPPPIVDRFEPLVQLGLAVIVGLGLATLAEYADPTLRNLDDIEQTGLQVLVSVPRD